MPPETPSVRRCLRLTPWRVVVWIPRQQEPVVLPQQGQQLAAHWVLTIPAQVAPTIEVAALSLVLAALSLGNVFANVAAVVRVQQQ